MNSIEFEGLGKRYRLGEHLGRLGLRDAITDRLRRGRSAEEKGELWALKDVTLEVGTGDILGIVGRNGAGKTTLLKIVSRITEPTTGLARVRGRVGSLLEVGTGFHHELTGRENIWLNGAVLGMSRREIAKRFDTIVEFSGIERFLDTPLKRYSTGMSLRLAFSVAAHLEPDVLVVDEVLAVGDAEFQRKCLGKVSELHGSGRTVLFVSHDLGAVGQLCDRVVWLDQGGVKEDGQAHDVLDSYLQTAAPTQAMVSLPEDRDNPAWLESLALVGADGMPVQAPRRDESLTVQIDLGAREHVPGLDLAIYLLNRQGLRVIDEAWSDRSGLPTLPPRPGRHRVAFEIPPVLSSGEYVLGLWFGTPQEQWFDGELLSFKLAPRPDDRQEAAERRRLVIPDVRWTVDALERSPT